MSGDVEQGNCDICGVKDVPINRKYYRYDVPCECHSPKHSIIVFHCSACVPVEPVETTITIKTKHLKLVE